MSSTFQVYEATIPAMHAKDEEVQELCELLTSRPAKSSKALLIDENGDIHFRVDIMDCEEHALRYVLEGDEMFRWVPHPLLDSLIERNMLSLTRGDPGWWYTVSQSNDEDQFADEGCDLCGHVPESFDPVKVAEGISTLILQEVLRKRLEAD
jgi:hypothetical protein